ncbi:MAG: N-6 DNA methylase [Candidatus Aenigmatarchaeota archaeon]
MDLNIQALLEKFKEGLTLDGRKKVFEDGYKLSSDSLLQKSDPEAFTKDFLVGPVLNMFELSKLTERHFRGITGELRKVDYLLKNQKNISFLVEAKSLNSDLFEKGPDGAVNQIQGLFRLAEVKENYKFGIATDGLKWVFIDRNSKVVFRLELIKELKKIKEILIGKEEVSSERIEEEISKKFYEWYNALLHGGKYKDHENKVRKISIKDCFVENILFASILEEREQIAQTIMDRLIFIKFLQSKNIVGYDILDYLINLDENILNEKIKQLFFSVLNTKKDERSDIDTKFKNAPYLNGSLFVRTEVELKNPDYKIKAFILKEVIRFLNSFKFVHTEDVSNHQILDPEILGYIFEKAMTAKDRKGTGAYYTRKSITNYISENTIHPVIVKNVNKLLKEKGYKDSEFLKDVEQVYSLRESTLGEVFSQVILNLKICDNACGSGAFLLAAADVLLEVYSRINGELRLKNSEIAMRKLILKNNLYGVDINPNAIEIAKLRLWLWLVTAYEPEKVEPLPNIDYNIRVGNSLIGYINISRFKEHKLTLLDWYSAEKSLNLMLKKREEIIQKYKDAVGDKARELKNEIDELDRKIKKLLDINLFQEISKKADIGEEEFKKLIPFHWGFEFYDVFDGNGDKGFDAVIGNPPYFKIFEKNIINKTNEYEEIKSGMMNAAAIFVNRTLNLTDRSGHVGMIVPKMLAFTDSWDKIRQKLLRNFTMERVIDCGKAFKGVLLEQVIFILDKSPFSEKHKIVIGYIEDGRITETAKVMQSLCQEEDGIYLEPNQKAYYIKEILEKSKIRLVDVSDITLGLGIQGKKDVFVERYQKCYNKVLRGNDIQRYYIRGCKFYDPNDKKIGEYKKTIEKFKTPHIVVQRIVAHIRNHIKITAALDMEGIFSFNTVTNIFMKDKQYDLKYILAILNSDVIQYYTYKFIYKNAIRSMDFYKAYAGKIPLPKVTDSQQKEIISLVDKMLELSKTSTEKNHKTNNEIEKIEEYINEIIYSHYGIGKEEQETIKESLK